MTKKRNFIAMVEFKHLPFWRKRLFVNAKNVKKAKDFILHIYKDSVKHIDIYE